jgi:hypothetical protein
MSVGRSGDGGPRSARRCCVRNPHPHRREPMSSIWQPLARARRRFGGRSLAMRDIAEEPVATDLTFALGRADLERMIAALAMVPGTEPGRPDTPARLEAAVGMAIARVGGQGTPVVTRRPAGLYTPETWQVDVIGADEPSRLMLERAIHGGEVD